MFGIADKPALAIRLIRSLNEVERDAWNLLNRENSPFLRHEFLLAMERHEAVGKRFGWLPRFLLAYNNNKVLVGAMPLYEKDNSYGELVFDWAWADAYHRHGIAYYPKLVSAIPYTPVTGDRLLAQNDAPEIQARLIEWALDYCDRENYSSLHCLFPPAQQMNVLKSAGLQQRIDVQYHWFNENYTSFDDFIAGMRNSKRKKIKQERRRVKQAGVKFTVLPGNELNEDQWRTVHRFYSNTFARKSGHATFNLEFFREISNTMGTQIIIMLAERAGKTIAAAINFRSDNVLYGRHWGCEEEVAGLHFETCYYQGIEYAISQGIKRFESGAQGEYKMSRGFMPVLTHSAHWIANDSFRTAINDSIDRETRAIRDYQQTLLESAPFKSDHPGYLRFQASNSGDS